MAAYFFLKNNSWRFELLEGKCIAVINPLEKNKIRRYTKSERGCL